MIVSTILISYGCYAAVGFVSGFIAGVYRDLCSTTSEVTLIGHKLDDGIFKTLTAGLLCGISVVLLPFIIVPYGCIKIYNYILNGYN